jgi:hypothetical protein
MRGAAHAETAIHGVVDEDLISQTRHDLPTKPATKRARMYTYSALPQKQHDSRIESRYLNRLATLKNRREIQSFFLRLRPR